MEALRELVRAIRFVLREEVAFWLNPVAYTRGAWRRAKRRHGLTHGEPTKLGFQQAPEAQLPITVDRNTAKRLNLPSQS